MTQRPFPDPNQLLLANDFVEARRFGRRTWLAFALVELYSLTAAADDSDGFQVIVPWNVPIDTLDVSFVADIFLKKRTRWADSTVAKPVDLKPSSEIRTRFSEFVLKRPVVAVRNYWQEKIFSGRDLPPPEVDSDLAVVRYVASHEGAIGYVSPSAKLERVKKVTLR
jgi:ABC-type phosphate transport system substrate-binding protein